MLIHCSQCRYKYSPEQLTQKKVKGKVLNLCPTCLHDLRKRTDAKLDDDPNSNITRRALAEDARTVVLVGKDVPLGFQADPEVIRKKALAAKNREAEETQAKIEKAPRQRMYLRKKGIEALRSAGYSEEEIRAMIKEGRIA